MHNISFKCEEDQTDVVPSWKVKVWIHKTFAINVNTFRSLRIDSAHHKLLRKKISYWWWLYLRGFEKQSIKLLGSNICFTELLSVTAGKISSVTQRLDWRLKRINIKQEHRLSQDYYWSLKPFTLSYGTSCYFQKSRSMWVWVQVLWITVPLQKPGSDGVLGQNQHPEQISCQTQSLSTS